VLRDLASLVRINQKQRVLDLILSIARRDPDSVPGRWRRGFPQGDQSAVDNSESFLPRAALGVLSEERAKMISRDLRFSAQIHGSAEMIFDLVADMPNYDRWLPDSSAFGGTVDVKPYPVRLGTTYLDAGPVLKPGL
jgi:hypothetical protein